MAVVLPPPRLSHGAVHALQRLDGAHVSAGHGWVLHACWNGGSVRPRQYCGGTVMPVAVAQLTVRVATPTPHRALQSPQGPVTHTWRCCCDGDGDGVTLRTKVTDAELDSDGRDVLLPLAVRLGVTEELGESAPVDGDGVALLTGVTDTELESDWTNVLLLPLTVRVTAGLGLGVSETVDDGGAVALTEVVNETLWLRLALAAPDGESELDEVVLLDSDCAGDGDTVLEPLALALALAEAA